MADQPFIYLVNTSEGYSVRIGNNPGGQSDVIGVIVDHPSQESRARLSSLLNSNWESEGARSNIQNLIDYNDRWPLLFLNKGAKPDPEFLLEERRIILPDSTEVQAALLPESEKGEMVYGRAALIIRVSPVSEILREAIIENEDKEPSRELQTYGFKR